MNSPIIEVEELKRILDKPNLCLFDCRFDLSDVSKGYKAYQEGHIPGAIYAHLDHHLSSPITADSGRHPLPDITPLVTWLGDSGVDQQSHIVVYDDSGGAMAVRLWWLLRWLGHAKVQVLNGQWQAWVNQQGATTQLVPAPQAKQFTATADHSLWLSTEAVAYNLTTKEYLVLDARIEPRFKGEMEPIDPVAGHIPDAHCLPLNDNLDANGKFKPAIELRQRFLAALSGYPAEKSVAMCGSGVTACHNILAMEIAGLPGGKLYAGSWSEWIRDASRPVATDVSD